MFGLNLVVLRCSDIEHTRRFYECLGMRFRKHAHGKGPEHYAAEDAGAVFELYPAKIADATGLGFAAKDLKVVADELRASGFDPESPQDQSWGRTFIVRDPDNRRVEIKEVEK